MKRVTITMLVSLLIYLFASVSWASNMSDARNFIKAGEYKAAIAPLEREIYGYTNSKGKEVAPNPTNAEAQMFLGDCYFYLNNLSQAKDRYKKAVRLNSAYRQKIVAKLEQKGYSTGNEKYWSIASEFDSGVKKRVANHYLKLANASKGETRVAHLSKASKYDASLREEYRKNANALGRNYMEQAKNLAKIPGKEAETEKLKKLARKYLGDEVVEAELPEAKVYPPREKPYDFALMAGEQTNHFITGLDGRNNSYRFLSTKSCVYDVLYDDGYVAKKGETTPKTLKARFKFRAYTDCLEEGGIGMRVK